MTAGLRPYPEYKDSGLPWLDRVPAHWEEKRAKYYFREVDERSATGAEQLMSVSHKTGVTPRKANVTMFMAESNIGHKICRNGDLVINTMWAWMAAMGVAHQTGIVSPSYGVYRPHMASQYMPDYADHLLRTQPYVSEYICRSTGIRASRLRLYPEDFLDIPVVCPPREEQEAIVRFITEHSRLVSRFIRNRRRLIEVLKEQKQAIINRAVTRGLDPNVPLKPSGIEWLGDIPEHWRKILLGAELTVINGYPFTSEHFDGVNGLPLIRIRDIYSPSTQLRYNGPEVPEAVIDSGDILVGMDGDFNVAIWRGGRAQLNQRVCCLRPRGTVDREYLSFLIQKPLKWINDQTFSTTVKHLSSNDLQHIRAFIPGADEQSDIVAFIQKETKILDETKDYAQREIDLIREYRIRLIADVVTGKVDVRHLAPETMGAEEEYLEEGLLDELPEDDEAELAEEAAHADD